jgi:hypothetical protein
MRLVRFVPPTLVLVAILVLLLVACGKSKY